MEQETRTKHPERMPLPEEDDATVKLNGHQVNLTHRTKLYWPKEKISKGQLIDYYLSVADVILPHLKNRPQSLHRFPNGITGISFYQKDIDVKNVPSWIKTESIHASSTGKYVDYLVCNNKATLAYMANLGCIELHPWLSRLGHLGHPDFIILDLDPEDIDFSYVIKTAQCIHEILEEMEIESYVKTSGATGIHIYIPVGAKYEYDTCRMVAEHIATLAHERLPEFTSIVRAKAQRKKKVYIDYLQNSIGQTVAAAYSVRPRAGATVSVPLLWGEVNASLHIEDFHIGNVLKRLEKKGDLWKEIHKQKNDLKQIIKKLAAE